MAIVLESLRTSPFLAERLESGTLGLHDVYFDIGSGTLFAYKGHDEGFNAVGEDDAGRRKAAGA